MDVAVEGLLAPGAAEIEGHALVLGAEPGGATQEFLVFLAIGD